MRLGGGVPPGQYSWMMFVDGEDFACRAKKVAAEEGRKVVTGPHYEENTFLWFPGSKGFNRTAVNIGRVPHAGLSVRSFYYTAVQGDEKKLRSVQEALSTMGFAPVVFKKRRGTRRKKVDVQLTIDMLMNAFMNNFDACVLVAGDQDYVPIVEEVQRLGKVVMVTYFDHPKGGLHPDLRLASDGFRDLTQDFLEKCCEP